MTDTFDLGTADLIGDVADCLAAAVLSISTLDCAALLASLAGPTVYEQTIAATGVTP